MKFELGACAAHYVAMDWGYYGRDIAATHSAAALRGATTLSLPLFGTGFNGVPIMSNAPVR